MAKKTKKRKHHHHSGATRTSTFRPLQESEARSLRQEIVSDFQKSKVFGTAGPILLDSKTEKMSEILIDFARPYLDKYSKEIGTSEKVLTLAVVGWNLALFPPHEKHSMVKSVLHKIPAEHREVVESVIWRMEERKRKYFNNIKRFIMNIKVSEDDDSLNVFVASTPTSEQMEELKKNNKNQPESDGQDKTEKSYYHKVSVKTVDVSGTAQTQENASIMNRKGMCHVLFSRLKQLITKRQLQ